MSLRLEPFPSSPWWCPSLGVHWVCGRFSVSRAKIYCFVRFFKVVVIESGFPSEIYYRGAGMWETLYGMVNAYPIVCFVFIPVYFNLGITSVYQYIELRFNSRLVRCLASGTYVFRKMKCFMTKCRSHWNYLLSRLDSESRRNGFHADRRTLHDSRYSDLDVAASNHYNQHHIQLVGRIKGGNYRRRDSSSGDNRRIGGNYYAINNRRWRRE